MKRIKRLFTKDPQPMTGGNKYEQHVQLEKQQQLDFATIDKMDNILKSSVMDIAHMTEAIREVSDKLIREKNIEPYFLLQAQADYFCNTCRFETSDRHLRRNVINVIRGAFLMGCAGMYKNTSLNILEPVYVTNVEMGIDGKPKKAMILPLSTCFQKMNEMKADISGDLKGFRTITDMDNLALFYWGTMGYSAWITKWPFVNLQHLMLTILIINGYVYNKKWTYKLNNYSNIGKEIELFFNPSNPFIVNIGNTEDLANRFSTQDVSSTSGSGDVIDYYNKLVGVYYHLMGRKVNNDFKKERNVSSEVEASQENYDVVQSDWLNQFEIFIEDLKSFGLDINVVKEQEMELYEDEEGEVNENGSNNNTTSPRE